MKTLATILSAAALAAVAVQPAAAHTKSYCANLAKHTANNQAAKKTIFGLAGGCVIAKVFGGKCGTGAAVGGIGGFAIGSAKWQQVYNTTYSNCRKS